MKNALLVLLSLVFAAGLFQACNPDCESLSSGVFTLEPEAVLPGTEVVLRSEPSDLLVGRRVVIEDPSGNGKFIDVESNFSQELDGVIARMPDEAFGDTRIFIEDPDCTGSFIFVDPLQVESEEFFLNSDRFIVPPIPLIIIPAPAVQPPVNIVNAWVSPHDRAYCIWFVPEFDASCNEKTVLRPLRPDDASRPLTCPNDKPIGSRELNTPKGTGACVTKFRPFIEQNPVSGIVDKTNNIIRIVIDRSQYGLPNEVLSGIFVAPEQLPSGDFRKGGVCSLTPNENKAFMLLTSQTTGQQLVMVKTSAD